VALASAPENNKRLAIMAGLFYSVHPETASFGPGRRFHFFAILKIAKLFLRLQKRSSLPASPKGYAATRASSQNLPFLNEH
jgi:hypothetical protein